MSKNTSSSFVIVPRRPDRRPVWWFAIVLAWALSLATAWTWAGRHAAPQLPGLNSSLETARARLLRAQAELESLQQREVLLARSDQISRAANQQVQRELAARDDEIASLRANLAFYERLAGATGQPKGLNVHSAQFTAEAGGTWRYLIVLTQNLNRSAVSLGQLRFVVEGVRDGKLTTLDWDTLHQREAAPAQTYSFRYFQQLNGSVMLPPGFTPQRVRVSLRGEHASLDQALAWKQPSNNADT
jgi:hypothetical protein